MLVPFSLYKYFLLIYSVLRSLERNAEFFFTYLYILTLKYTTVPDGMFMPAKILIYMKVNFAEGIYLKHSFMMACNTMPET